MNLDNSLTVSRFALLELRRARLWWFALVLVMVGWALGEFGAAIAITETSAHRLVFYAASMRLMAAFVVALLVATGISRDIEDGVVELVLSRPISRSEWFIGKFVAYWVALVAFVGLIGLPLIAQTPVPGLAWSVSLLLELTIVIGAALAFAVTIKQITMALCAVAGFYLLARGISAMALISRGPTVDLSLTSNQFIAWLTDILSYVLPDLDRFTRADWLITQSPTVVDLGVILAQSVVYTGLLLAVGLFDFHRRNF